MIQRSVGVKIKSPSSLHRRNIPCLHWIRKMSIFHRKVGLHLSKVRHLKEETHTEGWGRPGGGYRHPELTVQDYSSYRWPIRGVQRGKEFASPTFSRQESQGLAASPSLLVILDFWISTVHPLYLQKFGPWGKQLLKQSLPSDKNCPCGRCLRDRQGQRVSNTHYCLCHPDCFLLMQEGLTRFSSINSFYSSLEAFVSPTRTHLLEFCKTSSSLRKHILDNELVSSCPLKWDEPYLYERVHCTSLVEMPQSFGLQLWETPEGQVCMKQSTGLRLPASQPLEQRPELPLWGISGYLLYSNQTALPTSYADDFPPFQT